MEEISAKKGLLYAHTACRIVESYRSVSTRVFHVGLKNAQDLLFGAMKFPRSR